MKAKPEGKRNRPRNLSKNPAVGDGEPNWSPDGTKITFKRVQAGIPRGEIYRMDKDGTNQVRLTQNQVDDSLPAWSPDGTKIAFTSYRVHFWAKDPTWEIWTMDSSDGNPESQLTLTNPASEASWGPDWALRIE
jgi:Tol biopolymer transport system component